MPKKKSEKKNEIDNYKRVDNDSFVLSASSALLANEISSTSSTHNNIISEKMADDFDSDIITVDAKYGDSVLSVVLDTLKKNKQALVFVNTKHSAEKVALEISAKIKDINLEELSNSATSVLSRPTIQCKRLGDCIKRGIAFHHSGLLSAQREIIEKNFKEKIIRIIVCTPTLAAGVDLPAFRSIIRDVKRYGGRMGMQSIPVLEYQQMAGRAGRPKFDSHGESIIIAKSSGDKESLVDVYINGEVEDIYSKLAVEPVLRFYLLSLISMDYLNTKEQILGFFEKTFWAFQYKDMNKLDSIITRMLAQLEDWEFIKNASTKMPSDFTRADELTSGKYKTTPIGKRVAELYIDPLTANFMIRGLSISSSKNTIPFSYLQMISHTIEMMPLLRTKTSEWEAMQEKISFYEEHLLDDEPQLYDFEYQSFIDSIKTALFFLDWCDEKDEELLLEIHGIRPGEIRAKLDNANWLLYSCTELLKLLNFKKPLKEVTILRERIKYGVREELLPLLRLRGIGRVRARKLYNNKIHDLGDIKNTDFSTLSQLLGKGVAEDIKEQLGQTVDKESHKKRKGQIGLREG